LIVQASEQLERVIDLLGRRCTTHGEQRRAARTLVPLVRRLVGSLRRHFLDTSETLPGASRPPPSRLAS